MASVNLTLFKGGFVRTLLSKSKYPNKDCIDESYCSSCFDKKNVIKFVQVREIPGALVLKN
jgi:hypothetical protein